jgi:glycerophosphoryl diester phosphodiesterase
MLNKYFGCCLLVLIFWGFPSCRTANPTQDQAPALSDYFRYQSNAPSLISAHRGGRGYPGYPENCLQTMQYVHQQIPNAIFEVDIAQSKDGVLVLMHDNSLERTTNGNDRVDRYRYEQLAQLYLKDEKGDLTSYRIPSLEAVLDWADEVGVILMLDIKRSVDFETVLEYVIASEALDNVVMITYSIEAAQKLYRLNPGLMLSVSIRNFDELERAANSGIPWPNIVAFTGTRRSPPALYDALHQKGIKCILGTLGNIDKQAAARGDEIYQELVAQGVDIFATDRPLEAQRAVQ